MTSLEASQKNRQFHYCLVYHNHKVYHNCLVLFIASVFFCTYDTIKKMFSKQVDPVYLPAIHMGAACAGEIVSQSYSVAAMTRSEVSGNSHTFELHFCEIELCICYN
jgi:hypothetical protein